MTAIPIREARERHLVQRAPRSARTADGAIIPLLGTHTISDSAFSTWFARVPEQYALEDVLSHPDLWRKVEPQLRERGPVRPKAGDLMRLVHAGGDFDAIFSIEAVEPGVGYRLALYCGRVSQGDAA